MKKFDITIGKLRELIKDLPDDTPIGVTNHFGQFAPCDFAPEILRNLEHQTYKGRSQINKEIIPIALIIPETWIGPEPD